MKLEKRELVLKVKRLFHGTYLPVRANPTDAGADLKSPYYAEIEPHSHKFIGFGIAIELPENTVGLIFARSGLGSQQGITPRNAVGVIDEKYRGELGMMVKNDSDEHFHILPGDRIAQLVIVPVFTPEIVEVDELDMNEDRGGGFGSSGK